MDVGDRKVKSGARGTAPDGVIWETSATDLVRPPLDAELTDWHVHNRRPSHVNASRSFAGREYHLKWFFRRVFTGNPARREFENAFVVNGLGIPSVVAVGWGYHPRGTFFVMEGSPGEPIYELSERPDHATMERLTAELGEVVAKLHNADLCHRDLYVDHVLIHAGTIRLIDVERVMRFRRRRWIIKDLGGLLFSAWRETLPNDLCRTFLRSYLRHSRRSWSRHDLITAIQKKARGYWRHNRQAVSAPRRSTASFGPPR